MELNTFWIDQENNFLRSACVEFKQFGWLHWDKIDLKRGIFDKFSSKWFGFMHSIVDKTVVELLDWICEC